MSNGDLERAINYIKTGKKSEGGRILKSLVEREPFNEQAWLWLSTCHKSTEQKIYCLDKVLEINPNNAKARAALERLPSPSFDASTSEFSGKEKPRKRLSTGKIIGIFLVGSIALCGGCYGIYSILGEDSFDNILGEATQESSQISTQTSEPVVYAPPFEEIRANVETMTEAQWKAYLPTLTGMWVDNWTGWVEDVNVVSGGYELFVDMDSPDASLSLHDVKFTIPEDIALDFEIDQQVTFSGKISYTYEFIGSPIVNLEDSTFTMIGEVEGVPTSELGGIAPLFEEIESNVQSMTEAQWKAYLPTLTCLWVDNWTGWVEAVSVVSGGYELWVDMDSPDVLLSDSDVKIFIPEDIALDFEVDQQVTFSGRISNVGELLGQIFVDMRNPTSNVIGEVEGVPTSELGEIAPPFEEIRTNIETMTEAQREAYLPTLTCLWVDNWTGWVEWAGWFKRENLISSGFTIFVDMDSPDDSLSTHDVILSIPEDITLDFEIDQQVTFSGRIEYVIELFGEINVHIIVHFEDVVQ